ncbi:4-coumarate--CoA ligase-like 9 [Aristolochia californica]|uniref:4-coumarate--CoA ligase-like 9 n=1 Tax=Aristolochia californica TaxID=171875 RepID=UPI0035E2A738
MAEARQTVLPPNVDPKSGFCPETKTFYSLRAAVPLPLPDVPLSVASHALFLHRSSPTAAATAVIDSETGLRLSYAEFFNQAESLTASLQNLRPSLPTGCVAFILAPTSFHLPVLYFSLLSLGVAISPSNPLSTSAEISRQIQLTKPAIAFATSATVQKISSNIPVVLLDSPEFEAMTRNAVVVTHSHLDVNQSVPAAVLYSSGTTGSVKGVVLTHRNLIVTLTVIKDMLGGRTWPKVYLLTSPLFHVFGFVVWLWAVAMGNTIALMNRFQIGKALKSIEKFKVTHLTAAPPVVMAMAQERTTGQYDLSSLEEVRCGGAPLAITAMERFVSKFPHVRLAQGLGMTEVAVGISHTMGAEECRRFGSVGRLNSSLEAKIIDPVTGEPLPPRRRGELWIRGPAVMKGYIGDEAATAEALDRDGWLRTGDLCYVDGDGFLFVVDRLKELIKYKGYQVPPAELENLLMKHSEIVDAAVIPYPNEEAGEIPMAFVVRHPKGSLDHSQVIDFVARQVAPYKKIRRVAFVDSIPKTPSGKILRKELTKRALSASTSNL